MKKRFEIGISVASTFVAFLLSFIFALNREVAFLVLFAAIGMLNAVAAIMRLKQQ